MDLISLFVQPPNLFHVAGRDRVDVLAVSVSSDESDFEGSKESYPDVRNVDTETEHVDSDVYPNNSDDSDGDSTSNGDGHTLPDNDSAQSKAYTSRPAIRKSKRATAGSHSNPFHLTKSSCNAVSVSADSQVWTNVCTALVTFLFTAVLYGLFR